jgi:excinuclease UvrABC ATPase subunit
VKPALFSANSEGACPNCNGLGAIYTDLAMMAGVAATCEECEGKRFQASVLEYHLGGRDISEVLAMSVTEAEEFFGAGEARTPAAHAILDRRLVQRTANGACSTGASGSTRRPRICWANEALAGHRPELFAGE